MGLILLRENFLLKVVNSLYIEAYFELGEDFWDFFLSPLKL